MALRYFATITHVDTSNLPLWFLSSPCRAASLLLLEGESGEKEMI